MLLFERNVWNTQVKYVRKTKASFALGDTYSNHYAVRDSTLT